LIEETFAYGLVIGCSLFGIAWGTVNALLIKRVDMTNPGKITGVDGGKDNEESSMLQTQSKPAEALLD